MAIAVVVELCGVKSLSVAVGLYLPLSTTMPIFIGGFLRGVVERKLGHKEESEISSGMLYATGLVAGGAAISMLQKIVDTIGVHGWERLGATADLIGIGMFAVLCFFLVKAAREKLEV
jgi:uncharacterized oligopeptide transporter (OPT) family protein